MEDPARGHGVHRSSQGEVERGEGDLWVCGSFGVVDMSRLEIRLCLVVASAIVL